MSSIENHKKIINGLIKRGDKEIDYFFKFISYWIAFNCWLVAKTNEDRDRDALDKLYKESGLYGNFSNIINGNNKKLFDDLADIRPIENKGTRHFLNNVNDFKEVMNFLYAIRCNLFHGRKSDNNERDCEVINAAAPVLEIVVKNICLED